MTFSRSLFSSRLFFCTHAALVLFGRRRTHRNVNDISGHAGSHYLCSTKQRTVSLSCTDDVGFTSFTWEPFSDASQRMWATYCISCYTTTNLFNLNNCYLGGTLNTDCSAFQVHLVKCNQVHLLNTGLKSVFKILVLWVFLFYAALFF